MLSLRKWAELKLKANYLNLFVVCGKATWDSSRPDRCIALRQIRSGGSTQFQIHVHPTATAAYVCADASMDDAHAIAELVHDVTYENPAMRPLRMKVDAWNNAAAGNGHTARLVVVPKARYDAQYNSKSSDASIVGCFVFVEGQDVWRYGTTKIDAVFLCAGVSQETRLLAEECAKEVWAEDVDHPQPKGLIPRPGDGAIGWLRLPKPTFSVHPNFPTNPTIYVTSTLSREHDRELSRMLWDIDVSAPHCLRLPQLEGAPDMYVRGRDWSDVRTALASDCAHEVSVRFEFKYHDLDEWSQFVKLNKHALDVAHQKAWEFGGVFQPLGVVIEDRERGAVVGFAAGGIQRGQPVTMGENGHVRRIMSSQELAARCGDLGRNVATLTEERDAWRERFLGFEGKLCKALDLDAPVADEEQRTIMSALQMLKGKLDDALKAHRGLLDELGPIHCPICNAQLSQWEIIRGYCAVGHAGSSDIEGQLWSAIRDRINNHGPTPRYRELCKFEHDVNEVVLGGKVEAPTLASHEKSMVALKQLKADRDDALGLVGFLFGLLGGAKCPECTRECTAQEVIREICPNGHLGIKTRIMIDARKNLAFGHADPTIYPDHQLQQLLHSAEVIKRLSSAALRAYQAHTLGRDSGDSWDAVAKYVVEELARMPMCLPSEAQIRGTMEERGAHGVIHLLQATIGAHRVAILMQPERPVDELTRTIAQILYDSTGKILLSDQALVLANKIIEAMATAPVNWPTAKEIMEVWFAGVGLSTYQSLAWKPNSENVEKWFRQNFAAIAAARQMNGPSVDEFAEALELAAVALPFDFRRRFDFDARFADSCALLDKLRRCTAGESASKLRRGVMFVSMPPHEFAQITPPSDEAIQKALDKGRPVDPNMPLPRKDAAAAADADTEVEGWRIGEPWSPEPFNKLKHVRDLEAFEGTILSELQGASGEVYVEKWCTYVGGDSRDGTRLSRMLIVPTYPDAIAAYLDKKMTMLDLLTKRNNDVGFIVDWQKNTIVYARKVRVSTLPTSYLPKLGCMHDDSLRPDDGSTKEADPAKRVEALLKERTELLTYISELGARLDRLDPAWPSDPGLDRYKHLRQGQRA